MPAPVRAEIKARRLSRRAMVSLLFSVMLCLTHQRLS
jgi:hypothetical protein